MSASTQEVAGTDEPAGAPTRVPWHRNPRFAVTGMVVFTILALVLGAMGSSGVALDLGEGPGFLPPYQLNQRVPDIIAGPFGWALMIFGGVCWFVALRALAYGWRPNLRRLFFGGMLMNLAAVLVPPMTSADVTMYASYGRLFNLGIDPYTTTPAEVFRTQYDPILAVTEQPWQDALSVYGPILLWIQSLANHLGQDNPHNVVVWLQLSCVLAFIALCVIVVRMAGDDPVVKARAMLLTIASPAMAWAISFSAHNEAVAVALVMIGYFFLRKNPWLAGLFVGLGGSAKVTVVLFGLGMLWAYRHEPRKLVASVIGAGIPIAISYLVLFPQALLTATQNSGYLLSTTWTAGIGYLLDPFLRWEDLHPTLTVLSYTLMAVLVWLFTRMVPWTGAPGLADGADPRKDPLTVACRTTVILAAAWVFSSMWSLPWYDIMVYAPLALLGWSRFDILMAGRTALLNMSYILARDLPYAALAQTAQNRMRDVWSTLISVGFIVLIVLWWHRGGLRRGNHTKEPDPDDHQPMVEAYRFPSS